MSKNAATALLFIVSVILPIAMIVMGALYIDDCPREKYIPIYLIVAGAFAVLKAIILLGWYICSGDDPKKGLGIVTLINLFLFAWFIAGCYWIYHIHKDFQHHSPILSSYCNNTLYQFAFWVQIVFIIMMALEIIGGCIKVCCK